MAKPNRATARDILIEWLKSNIGAVIPSHRIEREVPQWGELRHNVRHNPTMYSRQWRALREEGSSLEAHGLVAVEMDNLKGMEKRWHITSKLS